ncbi:MAG: pyruvate kinase alpha/beta domain-containing protein [Candidatus Bathyarchaeia archaeon]
MRKTITYFERAGPGNTEETIRLAYERALELGIRDIVVASTHGSTALKLAEVFNPSEFNIVAVTISEGYSEEGWTMTEDERSALQRKGIKVFTGTHSLSDGVDEAFTGFISVKEIIAQTLYRFSQGMKVCVEVVLMAADAGLIPVDRSVIAIAGTDRGADTAIVVKPSYSRKFTELKIKEIICMPS